MLSDERKHVVNALDVRQLIQAADDPAREMGCLLVVRMKHAEGLA
jgi:hypothetical protein